MGSTPSSFNTDICLRRLRRRTWSQICRARCRAFRLFISGIGRVLQEKLCWRFAICCTSFTINRELSTLKRAFSLARIAGDIVYQPHIQVLDESDNVRQGFVNAAEFVKLHDNLPGYLKPIIEFLYLTGMRSGAVKKLEHKHVDLEAQVIRLPIELAKNKKG